MIYHSMGTGLLMRRMASTHSEEKRLQALCWCPCVCSSPDNSAGGSYLHHRPVPVWLWDVGRMPLSPSLAKFGADAGPLEGAGGLRLPLLSQSWLWNKGIHGPSPRAEPRSFDASS